MRPQNHSEIHDPVELRLHTGPAGIDTDSSTLLASNSSRLPQQLPTVGLRGHVSPWP